MGLEVELEGESDVVIDFGLFGILERIEIALSALLGEEWEFYDVTAHLTGEIEPPDYY